MKFNIIARKFTIKEDVRKYLEKKLSKLDKFFKDEPTARVVLGTVKDNEYIEAQINAGGIIFRAEATDSEMLAAIDKIVDIIERQIRKNKTRLAKRLRENSINDSQMISGTNFVDDEETGEFDIVKTKRFSVKPMSVEEAILQMKLLGHSFFVFKNVHTNEMNVVYERKDGRYALIESVD
jgi:putative sigma-54 modulation protein